MANNQSGGYTSYLVAGSPIPITPRSNFINFLKYFLLLPVEFVIADAIFGTGLPVDDCAGVARGPLCNRVSNERRGSFG